MDLYITNPLSKAEAVYDRQHAKVVRLESELAQHDAKHAAAVDAAEESGSPRISLERSHAMRQALENELKDARESRDRAHTRLAQERAKVARAAELAALQRLRELGRAIEAKAGVVEQHVATLNSHFQELTPLINELAEALPTRGIEADHAFNALGPGGLVGALMNHMARSGIPTVPLMWGPTSVPTFSARISEQLAVAMKSVGE